MDQYAHRRHRQKPTPKAKAEMMNAKKATLDRYERLVKEGFSTQQQYDSVETAYSKRKGLPTMRRSQKKDRLPRN